ncbi:MAG TPA: hypothetical protein VM238_08910 [Phycisphaerae bacterium]|nr:hypothetical protein [Phycisphaerae bacterium]
MISTSIAVGLLVAAFQARPAGTAGLPPPGSPGPWDRDVVAYCAGADNKVITFFGTGDPAGHEGGRPRGSLWTATSEDGQSWRLAKSPPVMGGDPGAVATKGGGWVIVITGEPRPGTPSARPRRPVPPAL